MKIEHHNFDGDSNENIFTCTVFKLAYVLYDENTGIEADRKEISIRVIHLIVIAFAILTLIRLL